MNYADLFSENLASSHKSSFVDMVDAEAKLGLLLARVQSRWPIVKVQQDEFIAHLARSLLPELALGQALGKVRIGELYLAFACVKGNEQAVSILSKDYLEPVFGCLARLNLSQTQLEEIKQLLRYKLLVGDKRHPPRIISFAGWAPLKSWLRVTVLHSALNYLRNERHDILFDYEDYVEIPATSGDMELQLFKRQYQEEFRIAFRRAVLALDSRQRNVLRMRYLGGMSIDRIGPIYNVHRATAARWLKGIRSTLLHSTRAILGEQLNLDSERIDSIMMLVQSNFEISMPDILASISLDNESNSEKKEF